MKNATSVCPHCRAKMVEYRHTLNANLARALAKVWDDIGFAIFVPSDFGLTHNQLANWHKLAYWGFIKSVGHAGWQATSIGGDFIQGKIKAPKNSWTYRGDVLNPSHDERHETGGMVFIQDLLPGYKSRRYYAVNALAAPTPQLQLPGT